MRQEEIVELDCEGRRNRAMSRKRREDVELLKEDIERNKNICVS